MKLIKNALTAPVVAISVLLLGIGVADAAIYLKADAPDRGDGTSWSTAFNTIQDAVAALNETGGETLRIAQGVYYTSLFGGHILTGAGFRLEGGYRALEDGDLERDPDVYQTIISAVNESTWKSAIWRRRQPNAEIEGATDPYGVKETDTASKIFTSEGRLAPFPEYVGKYDCFYFNSPGTYRAFTLSATASGTFEGLMFFGFNRTGSGTGSPLSLNGGAGGSVVTNCTFFGNRAQGGTICIRGTDIVTDCRFYHNTAEYGGGAGVSISGGSQVRNCLFVGCSRNISGYDGGLVVSGNVRNGVISNCVITRSVDRHPRQSATDNHSQGAIVCLGDITVTDCTITNNYGVTDSIYGNPLVSLQGVNQSGVIYGGGVMSRCLIAGNRIDVKPTDGCAYVLIGANRPVWNTASSVIHGCLIRDNEICAPACHVSSGTYALGVFGGGENDSTISYSYHMSAVDCAFVSNRVWGVDDETVHGVFSLGGLSTGTRAGGTPEIGLVNCTFIGPKVEGRYSVVQWGLQHTKPLNVVNCLFLPDGDDAVADDAIWSSVPSLVKAVDCTFKNLLEIYRPIGLDLADGIETDPVPVSFVPCFGQSDYLAPVAAVRMPGLRKSCDVATNRIDCPMTFAYRAPDSATWQPLTPASSASVRTDIAAGDDDLFGMSRPEGAMTRGAAQGLADGAETARTLVVRRNPFMAGSVSPGYAQAVADGETPEALTATPRGTGSFLAWQDLDGRTLSESATWTPELTSAETVVVAAFGTAPVKIVFDLEGKGVFESTGTSTCEVQSHAGMAFPEIPAFTVGENWYFVAWNGLPDVVPESDEPLVYTAKIVTRDVRVFYVSPDGTGDGSSWAQATSDFDAAYADASSYRGELRLKGGVYRIPATVTIRPNVALVGGFEGWETGGEPDSPEAHPTIFTGDAKGDDYWVPDGVDPGAGNRVPVWEGTTFNAPDAGWVTRYCKALTPSGDDVSVGFQDDGVSARNVVFRHLVFTGFGKSAISIQLEESSGLVVENCRFLANNTSQDLNVAPVFLLGVPDATVRNCEFTGNRRGLITEFTADTTNALYDVVFDWNMSGAVKVTTPSASLLNQQVRFERCTFRHNYSDSGDDYPAAIFINQVNVSRSTIVGEDLEFSDNITKGRYAATVRSHGGNNGSTTRYIYWRRLRFLRNRAESSDTSWNAFTAGIRLGGNCTQTRLYDSYFAENVAECTASSSFGPSYAASCLGMFDQNGYSTILNCTFERNVAKSSAAKTWACTAGTYSIYAHHGMANCMLTDNELTNTSDPASAAEFALLSVDWMTDMRIYNSVLFNAANGYRPIVISSSNPMPLMVNGCAISNYSQEEAALTANVHANGCLLDISEDGPLVMPKAVEDDEGLLSRGIRGESPFRKAAKPAYLDNNGRAFVRDAVHFKSAPWRCVEPQASYMTDENAAKSGLVFGRGDNVLPDAFGAVRNAKKTAYGPLNAPDLGLMLLVK